jgi:hypothetical protein
MRVASMRLLAVATLFAVTSCDQGVTAPTPSSTPANRLILSAPTTVSVVKRNTPLAAPISASATIGIFGGQISIPAAGIKVIVPALAVTSPTTITVTAVAGDQVAYEFQPHGIQFLTPLLVTQNLNGTNAASSLLQLGLKGGYFANLSDLNPSAGSGIVSELLGVSINLLSKTVTFPVFHFSGYLVATSENSSADDSH